MIYTLQDVKNIINVSAEVALSLKELLTELDSRSGDGDLGITMEKSAHALMLEIGKYEGKAGCPYSFGRCALGIICQRYRPEACP